MTRRCAICRRCLCIQDKLGQWRCPYGGPFDGYRRVAADGLTFVGPVERIS